MNDKRKRKKKTDTAEKKSWKTYDFTTHKFYNIDSMGQSKFGRKLF